MAILDELFGVLDSIAKAGQTPWAMEASRRLAAGEPLSGADAAVADQRRQVAVAPPPIVPALPAPAGGVSPGPMPSPSPTPNPAPAPTAEAARPQFGNGLLDGIGGAIASRLGIDTKHDPNLAYDILTKRGMNPAIAQAAARDPKLFRSMIPALIDKGDHTMVVNNKLIDKRTGAVLQDYSDSAIKGPEVRTVKNPAGDDVSAVWDAKQGRYVPIDVGGTGLVAPLAAPGAAPTAVVPKHEREAEQTAIGKARGEAKAALPKVEQTATYLLKQIDELANHKSLDKAVGIIDGSLPSLLPGTRDVDARIQQIQGGTFLQAFESLKGAGQITEKEGEKATAALNRLQDQKQGEAEYRQALKDFRKEVLDLTEGARKRAGLPGAAPKANDPLGLR